MTFFDTIAQSYVDVAIDPEIDLAAFLRATESLCVLLGSLGPAFSPVKSDIQGNIVKLSLGSHLTLQRFITDEQKAGKKPCIEALLWLKRALEFTSKSLRRNLDNPQEQLSVSFAAAYKITLSKHHSFLVRPIFAVAMSACPYREKFYAQLADGDEPKMMAQLTAWLVALEKQVTIIDDFFILQKL